MVLLGAGLGLITGSFFTPAGGDPMSTLALTFGVGMVTLACMVPWLKKFTVGPGGFEAETRDPAVVTTELSEEGPAAFVEETTAADRSSSLNEGEIAAAARWEIADAAIGRLLRPTRGPLAGSDLHLYMYDPDDDRLLPIFEPVDGESEGWKPGQGATGVAWLEETYILVTGPDTHSGTYGLTPEQQGRYRELSAVAALPVFNASGEVVAVLSASTRDPNQQLGSEEAFDEHVWLGYVMSRLLIEVLGWEND
jgi:hypothetical protein